MASEMVNRALLSFLSHESAVRLALAKSAGRIGVWELDLSTMNEIWDAEMLQLCGLSVDSPNPHHDIWKTLVHPEDLDQFNEQLNSVMLGEKEYHAEFWILQPTGNFVFLSLHGVVIRDVHGNPLQITGIASDITKHKRVEETLRTSMADLETTNKRLETLRAEATRASRAKSEFLANVSHELRTPMNGIIGMNTMLLDSDLSQDQRGYAQLIKSSGENMLALVNDLLDFSKAESSKLELDIVTFYPRAVLEDALELLSLRAFEKGLKLTYDFDSSIPSRLSGDPGRLRQIIMNLLANAIKFTDFGSVSLSVKVAQQNEIDMKLRFEIKDSGPGIPADKHGLLFRPFSQIDSKSTRKHGGTGLGLAISKQLVEMMDGEVGVESVEGQGSTFWFTIVCKTSPSRHPVSRCVHELLRGLRVLTVVSSRVEFRFMEFLLTYWGCQTETVLSGREAIALLESPQEQLDPFAVVFIDEQLPDMSGFELRKRIELSSSISISRVFMLLSPGEGTTAEDLEHVTKPIRASSLREILINLREPPARLKDKAAQSAATSKTQSMPRAEGLRVLVVEDNPTNQFVAQAMLKNLGHKSEIANDGKEAILALQRADYDLVFMDCQMPVLDGFQATKMIRTGVSGVRNPKIPIVAMTASAQHDDQELCKAAGMNDFISKPVDKFLLAKVIAHWASNQTPAAQNQPLPIASTAAPQTLVILDVADLMERLSEDRTLARELMNHFMQALPNQLIALRQGFDLGDRDQVRKIVHTIAGAAANLSAKALSQTAREIEHIARAGKLPDPDSSLSSINTQMEKLREFASDQDLLDA